MSHPNNYLQSLNTLIEADISTLVNYIVRDAVMEKRATRYIQQIAAEQGVRTLWQNGLARALAGETTLEEITRKVASDKI